MLRVAVCDDEEQERTTTLALLRAYAGERPGSRLQLRAFASGKALLWDEDAAAFDLYLLDVLMPGPNGIDTGLELRRMGIGGKIVFLTASRDYAVESYRAQAFYYLVKPLERADLFAVLDRAVEELTRQRAGELLVHTAAGVRRLPFDRLLWVERAGRRMVCHCAGGEAVESTSLRTPFAAALAPLLRDGRFAACGASYVVNLHHVSGVEQGEVKMDDGAALPLPRRAATGFKRAWMDHWLGETTG